MRAWLKRGFRTSAILIGLGLLTSVRAVAAPTLVLQFSDFHAEYPNLAQLVRTITVLAHDFQKAHPDGTVIILANGDIGGASAWTDDDLGFGVYKVLAELAKKYLVVKVQGNHGPLDWTREVAEGQLAQFVELMERSADKRYVNRPRVLLGNAELTPRGKEFFSPYQDLRLNDGRVLRVIGMGYRQTLRRSTYQESEEPLLFRGPFSVTLDALKPELIRAARDGRTDVILAIHEGFKRTGKTMVALKEWLTEQSDVIPGISKIKIWMTAAGHDHLKAHAVVGGVHVFDAQDIGGLYAIQLGEAGEPVASKFWSVAKQQKKHAEVAEMDQIEKNALALAEACIVERIQGANERKVGQLSGPIRQTKLNLKRGRQALGNALADALRDWGEDRLRDLRVKSWEGEAVPEISGMVTFFNSSAYRRTRNWKAGDIRWSDLKGATPFQDPPGLYFLTGSRIQEMFAELRRYRLEEKHYSPQLSSNALEGVEFALSVDGEALKPEQTYVLILDGFLARNGYKLASFENLPNALEKAGIPPSNMVNIFATFLPRRLNECSAYLAK